MNKPVFYNSNRYASMLRDLLETDDDTAIKFEQHFRVHGMDGFFENLDTLDVPVDVRSRLQAIKSVLSSAYLGQR